MNVILGKYNKLSKKERNQVLILLACALLSSYMIVAVMMFEKMFKAESMSNRRQNRIETRVGKFEVPEIENEYTQKDLDKVNAEIAEQKKQLMVYAEHLMPMDTPKARQDTKLAITYLAQEHNIDIERLDTSGTELRAQSTDSPKGLQALFSHRTAFSISTHADYFDFIAFVEDLDTLPYSSYIQNLSIARNDNGFLNVNFDLQM